jgi:hypothetical protein
MTAVYVGLGIVTVLLVLFLLMSLNRSGEKHYAMDMEALASETAAGCTAGVQLMVDELVERHGLKLSDILVAARAAQAAYEKLETVPGWPGKRLGRGLADGRALLVGVQIYCSEQEAAGSGGTQAQA